MLQGYGFASHIFVNTGRGTHQLSNAVASVTLPRTHQDTNSELLGSCTVLSANVAHLLVSGHTAVLSVTLTVPRSNNIYRKAFLNSPSARIPPEQKFCFLVWSCVRWLKHGDWHLRHYWHRYHEGVAASEMSVKMWWATPIQSWQMASTSKWVVFKLGFLIVAGIYFYSGYYECILFYFILSLATTPLSDLAGNTNSYCSL